MLHYIVINLRKPQGILFSIVSLAGHFHFGSRQSDVTFLPKQPHHRLCQLFIFFIAIEVARQSVGEQRGDAAAVACHHRRAKNFASHNELGEFSMALGMTYTLASRNCCFI